MKTNCDNVGKIEPKHSKRNERKITYEWTDVWSADVICQWWCFHPVSSRNRTFFFKCEPLRPWDDLKWQRHWHFLQCSSASPRGWQKQTHSLLHLGLMCFTWFIKGSQLQGLWADNKAAAFSYQVTVYLHSSGTPARNRSTVTQVLVQRWEFNFITASHKEPVSAAQLSLNLMISRQIHPQAPKTEPQTHRESQTGSGSLMSLQTSR